MKSRYRLLIFLTIFSVFGGIDVMCANGETTDLIPEITNNHNWAKRAFTHDPYAVPANVLIIAHDDVAGITKIGRSAAGGPIRLGNKTYSHGIGVNSHSVLKVSLIQPALRFQSDVGLDRNVDNTVASVRFHVNVAGKDLFATDIMRPTGEVQSIDVPLNGAKEFDLIVDNGGDDRSFDQGDWADAKVTLQDGSVHWLDDLANETQVVPDLPFSFKYGGKHSSDFIRTWKCEEREEPAGKGVTRRILKYTDPDTGMEVKAVAIIYTDTPGVDWTLHFTNTGTKDTPILEDIHAVDIKIHLLQGSPVLHSTKGSTACGLANLDDWHPVDKVLPVGEKVEYSTPNAFSAYGVSPFFNLDWGNGGVVTAIGWTGHWGFSVENSKEGTLKMEAGMRGMHLKLHPGESIRSPRVMQIYWTGKDSWKPYNLFRKTMMAHILPRINNELVTPPIAYTGAAFRESNTDTEKIEFDYVDSIKGLGFEYYWLDAWWMKGESFPNGMGQYQLPIERTPDPVRFPRGLRPLSDKVHENGMKFIVWFGPEAVFPNTFMANEHPEWLLSSNIENGGTLNLGIPEARRYITEYINTAIREYDIDCFRTDAGPDYTNWVYGDRNDPDRRGMTEIRYVEGLYKMWDDIRKANPHLFIDNCCGGGTRIDLETASRSISLWRTDGTQFPIWDGDPEGCAMQNQMITASLDRFIPYHTSGSIRVEPYYFRSGFNAGIILNDDTRVKDYPKGLLKQAIVEGKRIRKYYLGDYYPLTGMNVNPEDWCVMQYHRSDEQDGMVIAFRQHKSSYIGYACELRGIDSSAEYEVTKSVSYKPSKPVRMKGYDLQKIKLEIADQPGSVLVEYKRVSE